MSDALQQGAAALGVALDAPQHAALSRLASELLRWNRAYNLTAITDPAQVLTHHLLDSLSVHGMLAGTQVADVGTGAGFPGLPLAITNPQRRFLLVDAVEKKLRFIDHMARTLQLANVRTLHARVETLGDASVTGAGVQDTVVARAFAPLPRLLALVSPLVGADTQVLAMKGRWPEPGGADEQVAGWRLAQVHKVEVPGLDAERHVLRLVRDAAGS